MLWKLACAVMSAIAVFLAVVVLSEEVKPPLAPIQYLIDLECWQDDERLTASTSHLLVFNPGQREAELNVTAYFEDREPAGFHLRVPPHTTLETACDRWPVGENRRLALRVASSEPVITQATVGWNNTANEFQPGARTLSPLGVRETAKSYLAVQQLGGDLLHADGLLLTSEDLWIVESEAALVLNPNDQPAAVVLQLHSQGEVREKRFVVPARRLVRLDIEEIWPAGTHYGARFLSDGPIAAQWLREVRWHGLNEPMTYWSVPFVPGSE